MLFRSGITMPDYKEAQVSSDRAFWQIVGGYNNTMHVGAKFTDVIMEKRHIAKVLQHTKGNKTEASRLLKIGLTTLYRKIEEYGI